MEVTKDHEWKVTVAFNHSLDSILIPLPNGSAVEIMTSHRGGIVLRGVPHKNMGTMRVYPQSGNVVEVTIDERT
jgi:hypothetical protein